MHQLRLRSCAFWCACLCVRVCVCACVCVCSERCMLCILRQRTSYRANHVTLCDMSCRTRFMWENMYACACICVCMYSMHLVWFCFTACACRTNHGILCDTWCWHVCVFLCVRVCVCAHVCRCVSVHVCIQHVVRWGWLQHARKKPIT